MSTIGFIGAGAMGSPMALRLTDAGNDVLVFARSHERAEQLRERGHATTLTLADLFARDTIISCLLDDAAVREVHIAAAEQLARPGQLVVEHATFSPRLAVDIERAYAARGAHFAAAPVSGGPPGAAAGELVTMAGGKGVAHEGFDAVRAYCSRIVSTGDAASGLRLKLINQLLVGMHSALAGEVAALLRASGIDPEMARDALMGGWAASRRLDLQLIPSTTGGYGPDGAGLAKFREVLRHLEVLIDEAGTRRSLLPVLIEAIESVASRDPEAPFDALVEAFTPEEAA